MKNNPSEIPNPQLKFPDPQFSNLKILDEIPGFILLVLNPDFQITYINDIGCKILGYSDSDCLGSNWFDIFLHPSENRQIEEFYFKSIITEESVTCKENIILAKNKQNLIIRWYDTPIFNEQKLLTGYQRFGQDVTNQRIAQLEIRHRLAIEKMTSEIASTFLNLTNSDFDEKIKDALANIGVFTTADRGYLYQLNPTSNILYNSHEWCAKGIKSLIETSQNISINKFPWMMEMLNKKETILVTDLNTLPKTAAMERFTLESQGVQSFFIIPLKDKTKLYGFLGFDSESKSKNWSNNDMILLQAIAEIFTRVLYEQDLHYEKQKTEELFTKAFQLNPSMMAIISLKDFKFLNVNHAFLNHLSFTLEEILGNNVSALDFLVDSEQREIMYKQFTQRGRIEKFITPFYSRDRSVRIGQFSMEKITIKSEECILTTCVDMTEFKQVEKDLAIFKKLIEKSELGFAIYELNGKIIYINQATLHLVGLSDKKDALGSNVRNYFTKEYNEIVKNQIIPILFQERQWMGEVLLKKIDGTVIPTFQNIFILSDEKGEPHLVVHVMSDISEEKQTEELIREKEHRFHATVDRFPLPIAITDTQGNHLYLNPKFHEIFEYTLEDIPTTSAWMILAYPDEDYRKSVEQYWKDLKAGLCKPRANQVRCKNGQIKNVIFQEFSIDNGELVVVVIDVTEFDKNLS